MNGKLGSWRLTLDSRMLSIRVSRASGYPTSAANFPVFRSYAESMNMQSSHHQMFEMKRFKRQITQHISIPLATGKLGEFPQKWSFWTQICSQIDTLPP